MLPVFLKICGQLVAPFTGAWIEIPCNISFARVSIVAPFTGAWIEIGGRRGGWPAAGRRSLHGSVD